MVKFKWPNFSRVRKKKNRCISLMLEFSGCMLTYGRSENLWEDKYDTNWMARNYLTYLFLAEFSDVFSHSLVEHKIIGNYSLLVSVKGSNTLLKPYLIAGHFDVVPATNESWEVPPFEGRVQDGYFWGRGTLDHKNGVMVLWKCFRFIKEFLV